MMMQSRPSRRMVRGSVWRLLLSAAWSVRAEEPPAETVTVSKTYNNAPFEYRSRLLAERAAFRVYRLTYPSPVVTPRRAEQHGSRRLLPAQERSPGRPEVSGGDLPAHPRRQRGADRPGLLGAGGPRRAGHLVQAALLRRARLPKGPEALADDPKLFVGAIAQTGEDIRRTIDLLGLAAGNRSASGSASRASAWAASSPPRPPAPSRGSIGPA